MNGIEIGPAAAGRLTADYFLNAAAAAAEQRDLDRDPHCIEPDEALAKSAAAAEARRAAEALAPSSSEASAEAARSPITKD